MSYILALDQGTSSCRAIIFNEKAQIVSKAQKSITQFYLNTGWVEQDPFEILNTQIEVVKIALKHKSISIEDVLAVGITNQRETTIVWDKKTGIPIYRAIVWQDRRTFDICDKYLKHQNTIHQKTGLLVDPYFSATKIQWILHNHPKAKQKAEMGELLFGTVDTWLIWNLTKGKYHITDTSNASRTLLFNINTLNWDDEILELFDIPRAMLASIVTSSGELALIDKSFFNKKLPICAVIGDQQAALFGNLCTEYGQIKCTYGTGSFLMMNTKEKLIKTKKHLLTTIAWSFPDFTDYALEGSIFNAGSVLNWLKDELNLIENLEELEQILKNVDDSKGVYFVSALTGLGAPYWNPKAKGAFFGLNASTKKVHLLRSAIESIAFQVNDLLYIFKEIMKKDISEIKVDGGLIRSESLMQFQADISKIKIVQSSTEEITAIGAAFMAGLSIGFWSFSKLKHLQKQKKSYLPQMNSQKVGKNLSAWEKALKLVGQWDFYE
jgi:glycerol kinase